MAKDASEKARQNLKPQWFHILLSLAGRELHGTAIMEEVLLRTGGAIRLWPGTLYGALGDMADQGLIQEVEPPEEAPTEGGKRRFYAATREGRVVLADEVSRMEALVHLARARRVGEDLQGA
jgi:DNA-binding PadR family transcriptional regulator